MYCEGVLFLVCTKEMEHLQSITLSLSEQSLFTYAMVFGNHNNNKILFCYQNRTFTMMQNSMRYAT